MSFCRSTLPILFLLIAGSSYAQPERPIRRPVNNELALETIEAPVRVDVPDSVQGTTARLVFHVSPLSGKGLLSQQVRDALKALDKANGDAVFLKLRAFVAGTGDVRRVQSIVTEEFTGKKWPLPAITTVQVGALPVDNAQVVIESTSEERKNAVNPAGVVFISGQALEGADASVARLEKAMQAAGAVALRVSCFADSLAQTEAARSSTSKVFPGAAGTFAQSTRSGIGNRVSCEGVGRLPGRSLAAGAPLVERLEIPGQEATPDRSAAMLIRLPKLVFTGAQMAFVEQNSGIQQAYDRLVRAAPGEILFTNRYSVVGLGESIAAVPAENRPGRTSLVIEGLPALEANIAVEIVAAAK